MGGIGTWNLGLKYPELFSPLFILSPGIFDENGVEDAIKDNLWSPKFMKAYTAAFAPDVNNPEAVRVPVFDGSSEDDELIQLWESGFGNVKNKVEDYLKKTERIDHIFICSAKTEYYPWIETGTLRFMEILDESNIEYTYSIHPLEHMFNTEIIE